MPYRVLKTPIAFALLVAFHWFNALNARSDRQSVFRLGFFGNRLLLGGIGLALLLQAAVIYLPPLQSVFYTVPLELGDWGVILPVAATALVAEELRKLVAPRLFHRGK